MMQPETLVTTTLRHLKEALLLQQSLYKTVESLNAAGDKANAEYFDRAAFEIGSGIMELEVLFTMLGHSLPWQRNFANKKGS